jgi:threonine aldolase
LDKIRAISLLAKERKLKMHLDGARLFNASVATGIAVNEYAKFFDSVMFCFSKGLGAPIGSIIVGTKLFIEKAHRYRKMLGGGMRQVGILAAAANFALDNNINRLADDHLHAKMLATGLATIKGFNVNVEHVETNIVVFDVKESGFTVEEVLQKMGERGVLLIAFGETLIRAVTSLAVTREDIVKTIEIWHQVFG